MKKNLRDKRIRQRTLATRQVVLVSALMSAAILPLAVAEQNIQTVQHFDIPEQTLDGGLTELADRAGLKLLYPAEWVGDKQANAVSGDYTPCQALKIMLRDSGLNYRFTGESSVTLEKRRQSSLDDLLRLAASDDYRVAAAEQEEPYAGPVEQEDLTVQGGDWSGYNVLNASTATRTDTPILETPMTIQVVPRTVIDDQQTITVEETLRNVSGVVPLAAREESRHADVQ